MIVATMDIGSNTSLLLISCLSKDPSRLPDILEDRLFFTRLAEGFTTSACKEKERNNLRPQVPPKIKDSALKRQCVFFDNARQLVDQYSVEKIKCVATAAARKAQNPHQLLSIGKRYGFSIEIISAAEEAKISRTGALFQLSVDDESAVVLDIGGASTEISTVDQFFSLPLGSVNLTEKFIHTDPPTQKEISLLTKKIREELSLIPFSLSNESTLVATAGTPTTLAALEKKTKKVSDLHGEPLSIEQVHQWWECLFRLSFEKRKTLKGMPLYRADVMPAGLSILKEMMYYFQWDKCVASVTGLRYGLLCQFLNN